MSDYDLEDMLDLFDDEDEAGVQPSDIARHTTETSFNIDVYVVEDLKKGLRYNSVSNASFNLLKQSKEYKQTGSVAKALEVLFEEALMSGFTFNYVPQKVKYTNMLSHFKVSEVVENHIVDKLKSGLFEVNEINSYYDQFIKAKLGGEVQEPVEQQINTASMLYRMFSILVGATHKTQLELATEIGLKTAQIHRLKTGKVGLNAMNNIAQALNSFDEQISIDIFNELVTIKLPDSDNGRVLDYQEFANFAPSIVRYI